MPDAQALAPSLTPVAERTLKNRVGLHQTIRQSLVMAYRGLLKMRRTPDQSST